MVETNRHPWIGRSLKTRAGTHRVLAWTVAVMAVWGTGHPAAAAVLSDERPPGPRVSAKGVHLVEKAHRLGEMMDILVDPDDGLVHDLEGEAQVVHLTAHPGDVRIHG